MKTDISLLSMDNLLRRRFDELSEQAEKLETSKKREFDEYTNQNRDKINSNALLNWKVKAESLIDKVCGSDSPHAIRFREADEGGIYTTDLGKFRRMRAVFDAAKEGFEGGYLVAIRSLVQAEVFSSELEQASELLKSSYALPAAVIAGAVLETAIRDLCTRNGIVHAKLDKMNADLTKSGVYNLITQKRITHLAAVRNSAAHGNKDEFATYDVSAMIEEVERFLSQYLA
jgi:hypothetical protein